MCALEQESSKSEETGGRYVLVADACGLFSHSSKLCIDEN